MNRRRFLKHAGTASTLAALPGLSLSVWGLAADFTGDFLLYIQASGGWDVTSFCDPKMNVAGEQVINNWALSAETQFAGNLAYAPVADNAAFFNDHYQKTMVINGVNVRTNNHSAGTQYSHTGSQRGGTPHLAALYAYEKGLGMAMPVIATSRFVSAGLVPPTILGRQVLELINPNLWSPTQAQQYLPTDDLDAIRALRAHQAITLENQSLLLPKQNKQVDDYYRATFADTSNFGQFRDYYLGLEQGKYSNDSYTDSIKFAMTAFKTSLGVAADMYVSGFDSHDNHDTKFSVNIKNLNNALGCAWHYAEQLGIADRLLVVVSSDFGRTPLYNSDAGKDHWPYGSTLVMKKNVSWTNRAVGHTDGGHVGRAINRQTLAEDRLNGEEIEPKHVMHALRNLLGIADTETAQRFDLKVERPFNLFGA